MGAYFFVSLQHETIPPMLPAEGGLGENNISCPCLYSSDARVILRSGAVRDA